jgi:hypothetical protein
MEGIPMFSERNRPSAYRFVKLIDVMYENKVRMGFPSLPTYVFTHVVDVNTSHTPAEAPQPKLAKRAYYHPHHHLFLLGQMPSSSKDLSDSSLRGIYGLFYISYQLPRGRTLY